MNIHKIIKEQTLATLKRWEGFEALDYIIKKFPRLNLYTMGGVIRDIILENNMEPRDHDFFFSGEDPQVILSELNKFGTVQYGQFGSPRWHPANSKIYADIVYIPNFNTGLWQCEDIIDVLNQADITANAIALDLKTAELFNPQNGINHAQKKILRAVRFDFPDRPVSDQIKLPSNSIMWFRFLNQAAALNLSIEPRTMQWILENKDYMKFAKDFEHYFYPLHPKALTYYGF